MSEAQVRERTPQNMDELVVALVNCPGGADVKERMKAVLRDYLASHFSSAISVSKNHDEIGRLYARCILGSEK